MYRNFVAASLAAATTLFAPSVLASGYGPAPFYRPDTGAPDSQRGPSLHTLFSRHTRSEAAKRPDVGGVDTYGTQSGSDAASWDRQ